MTKKIRHSEHLDSPTRCTTLMPVDCVQCQSVIPKGTHCIGYCTSKAGKLGYVICADCVNSDPDLEDFKHLLPNNQA